MAIWAGSFSKSTTGILINEAGTVLAELETILKMKEHFLLVSLDGAICFYGLKFYLEFLKDSS